MAFRTGGGSFVYGMSFWGIGKWPLIGGWLLIRVAAYNIIIITALGARWIVKQRQFAKFYTWKLGKDE